MTTMLRVINDGHDKALQITTIDPTTGVDLPASTITGTVVLPGGISKAVCIHSHCSYRIDEISIPIDSTG
jgi:hypothetical protein